MSILEYQFDLVYWDFLSIKSQIISIRTYSIWIIQYMIKEHKKYYLLNM